MSTNYKTKAYQTAENNHVDHILDTTRVPADITDKTASMAADIGLKLAESLDLIGLLAVEMFVMGDGTVVMNEIAPRPHNSGHWTQDGAQTSQFEQFVRAITGQPLGETKRLSLVFLTCICGFMGWGSRELGIAAGGSDLEHRSQLG